MRLCLDHGWTKGRYRNTKHQWWNGLLSCDELINKPKHKLSLTSFHRSSQSAKQSDLVYCSALRNYKSTSLLCRVKHYIYAPTCSQGEDMGCRIHTFLHWSQRCPNEFSTMSQSFTKTCVWVDSTYLLTTQFTAYCLRREEVNWRTESSSLHCNVIDTRTKPVSQRRLNSLELSTLLQCTGAVVWGEHQVDCRAHSIVS